MGIVTVDITEDLGESGLYGISGSFQDSNVFGLDSLALTEPVSITSIAFSDPAYPGLTGDPYTPDTAFIDDVFGSYSDTGSMYLDTMDMMGVDNYSLSALLMEGLHPEIDAIAIMATPLSDLGGFIAPDFSSLSAFDHPYGMGLGIDFSGMDFEPMSTEEFGAYMERNYGETDPWMIEADRIADKWSDSVDNLTSGNILSGLTGMITSGYEASSHGWTAIFQETIPEETLTDNAVVGYLADRGEGVEQVRTAVIDDMDTFSHDPWNADASWLGARLNDAADAGDVYWQDGAGTYAKILYVDGTIIGVGNTVESLIELPDFAVEMSGHVSSYVTGYDCNWNLWDTNYGGMVADTLIYDKIYGGTPQFDTIEQAKLAGFGAAGFDISTIFITPAAWAKLSRSRQAAQGLGYMGTLDVVTTGTMAPFSVAAEVGRFEEQQAMNSLDQTLEQLGVSSFETFQAVTLAEKMELCDRAVTEQLAGFGAPPEELAGMTLDEKLNAYSEITGIAVRIFEAAPQNTDSPAQDDLPTQPLESDVNMRGDFDNSRETRPDETAPDAADKPELIGSAGPARRGPSFDAV